VYIRKEAEMRSFIMHSSPNIIRMIKLRMTRCMRHVPCMREMRNPYNILVGKPEGKRPL
jgi:hypothetical protein